MAKKVRYVGEERDTENFGHAFKRDKWIGAKDHTLSDDQLAILGDHPLFEVAEEVKAPAEVPTEAEKAA